MPTSEEIYQRLLDHFPFDTPRPEQIQAFEQLAPWIERLFIQNFDNALFFGVDAPTGIGKSPIAVTVAMTIQELYEEEYGDSLDEDEVPQVWVVTQNKLLQDQYQRDFPDDLFDLRGLDNYQCYEEPGKTCGQATCGRIRAKEKDKEKGKKPPAVCFFNCEYDKVKRQAMSAPILSMNVAKALAMLKSPGVSRPVLMIFDEGHEVENALDSESTFTLTPEELQKLFLLFPHYFHDLGNLGEIREGMKKLIADCIPHYEAEERANPDVRDVKRYKKLESIITKTRDTLEAMDAGIEFVSCSNEKLELKPLQVYKVFARTFTFPTIFLSATLLSKVGFQSMTGIEEKKLDWFACQSPFPVENRPIRMFWRIGAVPLNYENLQNEMPNLINRARTVLLKHPAERGIIHTHTYKIAERFYQELYPEFGSRILFPKTAKEQKDALIQHAKIPNAVLLSPSMTQGVDLRDDLCRFSALAKVPWLPTNDPVVRARMEADRNWYTFKTCQTVVQAPGRGVRSATDFAETYLLDPGFARFFGMAKAHLPQWFKDSLIQKPCGYY